MSLWLFSWLSFWSSLWSSSWSSVWSFLSSQLAQSLGIQSSTKSLHSYPFRKTLCNPFKQIAPAPHNFFLVLFMTIFKIWSSTRTLHSTQFCCGDRQNNTQTQTQMRLIDWTSQEAGSVTIAALAPGRGLAPPSWPLSPLLSWNL